MLNDENSKCYKLCELCNFLSGARITKDECSFEYKYPIISGGENIMGFANKYNFDDNNITISRYGKAGYVSYHTGKIWVNDVAYVLKNIDSKILNYRFLYYELLFHQKDIYSLIMDGTIPPHISPIGIKNLKIIIPPIKIQNIIVSLLDQFNNLTTNLQDGIPAEINLRKEQYQYYLKQLLTFNNQIK